MTQEELNKIEGLISGQRTSEIMEYRGHIAVLKNNYRNDAYRKDPTNTAIYENGTVAKIDINNTKRSVQGVNHIARKAAADGKKEAEGILEKFAQTYYGDRLVRDAEGLNPIASFRRADEFEKAKPLSVSELEQTVRTQEEYEQIRSRVGTEVPARGNKPIYDTEEGYLRNFSSDKAVAQLLKSCIPCEFRKLEFTAEFGMPWANTLDDLKKKWKDLLALLRNLTTFRPGEFSQDLCNLFKFLDGQCIPDITGLLSLLSLMQLKYTDLGSFSLGNIIGQLIAPFLSPVIGSFTSNLDRLSDMIVGPLRCIVRALEFQITELQEQINGAINIADLNRARYHQNQLDFIEAKAKALRNRQRQLNVSQIQRKNRDDGNQDLNALNSSNPSLFSKIPSYVEPGNKDLYAREERLAETNFVRNGLRVDPNNAVTNSIASGVEKIGITQYKNEQQTFQITIDKELENIDKELKKLQTQRQELQAKIGGSYKNVSNRSNVNFNSALNITTQTRFALDNMERSFNSIITELVAAVNDGIGIVKQSIDIYREEFQRLLLGRISTQQDQIEFTRLLQNIARLTSIVRAVNDFKKAGWNLKKFCERGADNALSQVAKSLKANDNSGMFDFYRAQDADGNPLIVIAPGGAQLSVSSVDFDALGGDALFGDSNIDLDSVTKTITFNDLNEVDKLNREGIVPDLGNIDAKNIEINISNSTNSQLDLHFKNSYAIISNEFCSKSAINFGSSDTVKKWAESLWQKS